jgi:hypothetical protein
VLLLKASMQKVDPARILERCSQLAFAHSLPHAQVAARHTPKTRHAILVPLATTQAVAPASLHHHTRIITLAG